MDWKNDVATNLWILPRGVARNGQAGPNSIKWTAKYGSVIATGYDVSTTDGVNEAGLVANVLWLVESEYPQFDQRKPGLTIAAWAQYVLDNFATVREAVEALEREPFVVVTDNVPGEARLTTLHLSMSDATGDSAIVEYIGGKQVIHHGRQYQVIRPDDAGAAEHFVDPLAHCHRPQTKAVFLRVRAHAKHVLGRPEEDRFFGRDRQGQEARSR